MLCDMYVIDRESGDIHKIGDDTHDSIVIMGGEVHYHNLQNGDGGTCRDDKDCGYCIIESRHGMLEDEYGIIDKRFEEEIDAFMRGEE